MISWKDEKEKLEDLILVEEKSYDEIGSFYGCTGSNIRKVAKRLGISLPQRRTINENETFNKGVTKHSKCKCLNCGKEFISYRESTNKFCSRNCCSEYRVKQKYEDYILHPEEYKGKNIGKWVKKHILVEQDNKCAICGCEPEWNGKPLVFILDHIDGHANNNNRENLRLVCPNCDSQLDTYKSKNKNSDRVYYKINVRKTKKT